MFMKLNDIYEAQYSGHERGSFHWILDKFFVGPNIDNEYWLDENRFIALYKGKEIIGVRLEDHAIVMIPNVGVDPAFKFTSFHKIEAISRNLHVYSSKRLI